MIFVKKASLFVLVSGFIAAFAYFFPRFLSAWLGEQSPFISWLYTYGMGFVFFVLTIALIWAKPVLDPLRRREELFWLMGIFSAMTFMFCMHGLWIYLAVHFPVKN